MADNRHSTNPQVLTNRHLQEKHRDTTDQHREEVRDQEGPLNKNVVGHNNYHLDIYHAHISLTKDL